MERRVNNKVKKKYRKTNTSPNFPEAPFSP
jgi:hypothetical protein